MNVAWIKKFLISAVLGVIILNGLGIYVDITFGEMSPVRQFIYKVGFSIIGLIFVSVLSYILGRGGGNEYTG